MSGSIVSTQNLHSLTGVFKVAGSFLKISIFFDKNLSMFLRSLAITCFTCFLAQDGRGHTFRVCSPKSEEFDEKGKVESDSHHNLSSFHWEILSIRNKLSNPFTLLSAVGYSMQSV